MKMSDEELAGTSSGDKATEQEDGHACICHLLSLLGVSASYTDVLLEQESIELF